MSEHVLAWHFLADDGKRRDGRKPKAGGTEHYGGPLKMCESGLHACEKPLDALNYAQGSLVRRVECWGDITRDESQPDKFICRHRRELWRLDATRVLHEFACRVAEDALKTAKIKDKRFWNAIATKYRWLDGKATDEELAAARDAAWAAARAAARDAAWAAARDAAWAAAWDAARDKYNTWLAEMLTVANESGAQE